MEAAAAAEAPRLELEVVVARAALRLQHPSFLQGRFYWLLETAGLGALTEAALYSTALRPLVAEPVVLG